MFCSTSLSCVAAHEGHHTSTPQVRDERDLPEDPRIRDILDRFSKLSPERIAWLFTTLDLDLRKNKHVVIAAVTKNPAMFSKKYFGDPNRKETNCRPRISPISAHMCDKDIALAAISVDASAFKRADKSLKTDRSFIDQAVSINNLVRDYLEK